MEDFDFFEDEFYGEMIDMVRGNIYAKELMNRINHTPNRKGKWKEERGISYFEITDIELLKRLRQYSCQGIEYDEYAEPDFSKYAIAIVSIENMGYSRRKNFRYATEKFLKTNKAKKENILSGKEFKQYKKKNKLSWHECSDGVTMMLLPRIIHQTFTHCGGIAEYAEMKKQESLFEGN